MKEDLDFHDRELIALFCNPGTNTMQIYISYRPGKILKIYIRDIEKIENIIQKVCHFSLYLQRLLITVN